METTQSLAPIAAAVLNISPDHIDRHGSLERYTALKVSLLVMADHAVVNQDDPLVRELAPKTAATIPFSVAQSLASGWSVVSNAGRRWLACDGKALLPVDQLGIGGDIGIANALAALALCQCLGGDPDVAIAALPGFRGLPHRRRLLRTHQGVAWIDDSKGTNVGASVAAIKSAGAPVVLIAGGQSKGADFAPLVAAAAGRVRAAVLLGEAAPELERLLTGVVPTQRAASMQQAVAEAARIAVAGDCVLLSPACASQDMFRDYRDRGEAFATAVEELAR
jgi:UDP-N-acetylmuramoylalanine--D-glutamate ligase